MAEAKAVSTCWTWDPSSMALDGKNDATLFEVGTVMVGRDRRDWVVAKINKPTTSQFVITSKANTQRWLDSNPTMQWVLAPYNEPILRPICTHDSNGVALQTVDWWKWSTIAGIEHFRLLDCGAGGDCFFHAVGRALGVEMKMVRNLAASGLTEDLLPGFLEEEIDIQKESGEYCWSPLSITSLAHMQSIIRTCGNTYWGDTSTIGLLSRTKAIQARQIGFVILRRDGIVDPRLFAQTTPGCAPITHLVMLYNCGGTHYKLVLCDGAVLVPRNWPAVVSMLKMSWLKEYDTAWVTPPFVKKSLMTKA